MENLIALTPSQHFTKAHPNGNTQIIDKGYQQICLLAKADHIEQNIKHAQEVIYSFDDFMIVLATGLNDERFHEIDDGDYSETIRLINMDYVTNE